MTGIRRGHLHGHHILWLSVSFAIVFALCVIAVVVPMRLGERWISRYELGRLLKGRRQKAEISKQ